MRLIAMLIVVCAASQPLSAAYLYKAMMVRAAPGRLLNLIELYKERMPYYDASGDERPLWMRHSQGDQWDLLFLFPMTSFSEYYSPGKLEARTRADKDLGKPQKEFATRFYSMVAWHEEVFVDGPPLEEVKKAFDGAGFFHVEMFQALPGMQQRLLEERKMENTYLEKLSRPRNLIFSHEQGAAWDLFTIGTYRDVAHFAESGSIPETRQEEAAKAAGFESSSSIGPYLRTLIASHHDTLAVAVK